MKPSRLIAGPAALLLAVGLAALAGCGGGGGPKATTDFRTSANKIRPGMTQSQVRDELGKPDKEFDGVVQVGNPADPSAWIVGRAPAGSRYERWFYDRGDTHYHVYFGRSVTRPGRYEVVNVRANPEDAAVAGTSPPPP